MEEFNIIPNRKQIFFKTVFPPPRDTGIPLKYDYIFIKEVDTSNGISYHGGNDVIHDFWYLGKGGDEGDKIFKKDVILLTYLPSVLIFIKQYSDSMCFSTIYS